MGLPTSDIDLMIIAPSIHDQNPYVAKENRVQALFSLAKHFGSQGIFVKSVVRPEALIPILEMEELETGIEVDISFEEPYSQQAIMDARIWINRYGTKDLVPLVLLLKHSLNMRELGLGAATTPYQVITPSPLFFIRLTLTRTGRDWIVHPAMHDCCLSGNKATRAAYDLGREGSDRLHRESIPLMLGVLGGRV